MSSAPELPGAGQGLPEQAEPLRPWGLEQEPGFLTGEMMTNALQRGSQGKRRWLPAPQLRAVTHGVPALPYAFTGNQRDPAPGAGSS